MARVMSYLSSAINSLMVWRGSGGGPAGPAYSNAFSTAFDRV
jgi:hypothetical protein